MFTLKATLVLVASLNVLAKVFQQVPGSDIQTPSGTTLLKTGPFGSKLYKYNADNAVYQDAPYLIDLTAPTLFQQGYDNGYLLGQEYSDNYDKLMFSLLGDDETLTKLVGIFVEWQWKSFLSVQVPDDFKTELNGMTAGGLKAGLKVDVGAIAARGITFANLPGTLTNFKYILLDEKNHPNLEEKFGMPLADATEALEKLAQKWAGLTCSMFGTWGSRTEGGRLFTGRNLDWLRDTGISQYKLITVHHPPKGHAHATFGWAGIWGSITGISEKGITAHEANLESDDITFRGFPWVLRLRHVMANAQNIAEATALWNATNNTVGFNHGFGSAQDNRFVALETMMHNTAVFEANDPREQNLVVDGVQIGQAREEALFRTNHGYDTYTLAHYIEESYNNSIQRYMLFPAMFDNYQAIGKEITYIEAVNITSIVGSKGTDNFYQCVSPFVTGSNILSVTYDPSNLIAYAAWENHDDTVGWVPAACNTYLKIDMNDWFKRRE